jgi:hypothetical protein
LVFWGLGAICPALLGDGLYIFIIGSLREFYGPMALGKWDAVGADLVMKL